MTKDLKKILIIDDEVDICTFTKRALDRTGIFETFATQDSEEGITIAKSKLPDLILLDINMPKLDGGEVAQELSQYQPTSAIPIVFVTALLKKDEADADGKINKHFFLPKPISAVELIDKVSLQRVRK